MSETSAEYLLSAMSQYGYSLLEPDRMPDPNELLAALARSDDVRVLEGFPVVFANALAKRRDAVDLEVVQARLKGAQREHFLRLMALAFSLLDFFGLEARKPEGYESRLRRQCKEMKESLGRDRPFRVGSRELNPARVKKTFLRYFVHAQETESVERKARLREEFRREYYLSLFFAPRQRDLLQKKLRGEALTKTEREYFSRVVKKKLLALADPDLHRLAQKALQ